VQDAANLNIIGSIFKDNEAWVISPATSSSTKIKAKGMGGALFLDCLNEGANLKADCNIALKSNNIFTGNAASHEGGAISWISNRYSTDNTEIFFNNSAFYGDNVASYPYKLDV